MRRVLIDCDAGSAGLGHLGRSVALGLALADRGARVAVHVRGDDHGMLARHPQLVRAQPDVGHDVSISDRSIPLAVTEAEELARNGPLCLIDDPGPARALADVVVGPPTSDWEKGPERLLLEGPEHVLVRPEFRDPSPDGRGHVLVTMGGADPAGLTVPVSRVLAPVADLRILARQLPADLASAGVTDADGVSSLYRGASIVVCAFGHTLLEAATMHVPALYTSWPDQDEDEATSFERWGTAVYLGPVGSWTPDDVPPALEEVRAIWPEMCQAGRPFDGRGATRVADALLQREPAG